MTSSLLPEDNRLNNAILVGLAILLIILFLGSGCRVVKKSEGVTTESSNTATIIDTVHVTKYDTTVTTHELINYQTKTIELFDTVITPKDSVVVVLKSRTIYSNGTNDKTEIKKGIGSDSSSLSKNTQYVELKSNKSSYKDVSSFPWWLIGIILLAGLFIWLMIKRLPNLK